MKKAFTLAEVLITLMIIGIIAALTIPSIISNYQQQEFKTGLKKAVSVLNEAIQTNIAQEGETPYVDVNLADYLMRHMSVIKSQRDFNGNIAFYTTDGMRFEIPETKWQLNNSKELKLHETGINLNDGREKRIETGYGYCGSYGLRNNPNSTVNPPCIVTADVNGDKKPNPKMEHVPAEYWANGYIKNSGYTIYNYSYPFPYDKKLSDIFTIMITDEKAIPFGVVAQRAMYSK